MAVEEPSHQRLSVFHHKAFGCLFRLAWLVLYGFGLSAMRLRYHLRKTTNGLRTDAFTIVEALVAIVILMIFAVTSTMSLNFFDERAARNRNAEAARAIVEDYVNYLLGDSVDAPAPTAAGTDLDGDGMPDGVICTLKPVTMVSNPAAIPLVVRRIANPTQTQDGVVVTSAIYWRVQNVGLAYGCAADTDLVQVNFLLQYTYRKQTYYYKSVTFKADLVN